jgi:23S rRNA-/tRNA-specific pseudouridylate synthase
MLQNASDHYRLVHRIDKETSGILVIAKNLQASRIFTELFRNNQVYKEYIAINKGKLRPSYGVINLPINQNEELLSATTEYEILEYLKNNLTLTKFIPQTGRKHQLRIHSTLIDYPILGDKKYDKSYDKHVKNLFLHAHKIGFYFDRERYEFTLDLPEHFNKHIK